MINITNRTSLAAVTTAAATTLLTTIPNNNNNNNINNNSSNNNNNNISNDDTCPEIEKHRYQSVIGVELAVPQWEAILVTIILTFIILLTIIGNTLVILSVFTYKPLRIVQNFFIVSLAVADLTVAILVLPFNVLYIILGRWIFSIHLCKMWLTSDVLCCTSSILNLCAIALDRFWAITDPINYAQKRTLERVLYLIAGVWILSLIISSPPLIGWNDWPEIFESDTPCTLNSNPGYRIYSALGSFFIPLVIMTIVYIEIFIATRRRLRERARATRLNATHNLQNNNNSINNNNSNNKNKKNKTNKNNKIILTSGKDTGGGGDGGTQHDQESISSETNHNEHQHNLSENLSHEKQHHMDNKTKKKDLRKKAKDSIKTNKKYNENLLQAIVAEDSITDIPIDDDADNLLNSKYNNGNNECINVIIIDGNKTTINLNDDIKYIDSSGGGGGVGGGGGGGGIGDGGVCDEVGINAVGTTTTPTSTTTTPTTTTSTTTPKFTTKGTAGGGTATANVLKKSSNVYQFIEEKQKISLSKERRAARTLGIIMGVFILCWVPFFLLYIIVPFCPTCCPSDRLIDFLTWLGYINSALNPIIYTIFNLEYRRAFKKLLGIKF